MTTDCDRPVVHPGHRRSGYLLLVPLMAGILAGALSVSMINTAIPRIADDLGADAAGSAWIVDVYPLVLATCIVFAARLGDRIGRRTTLLIGLTIIAVVNLAAAFAVTPGMLVAARAILGFAGALVVASVVATIIVVYEGRRRLVANAVWVSVFGAGGAAGPVLGGVLTEIWGWRAVFVVTVPIAAVGIVLTPLLVPESRSEIRSRWDVRGFVYSSAAVAAIVFGVQHVVVEPLLGSGVAVAGIVGLAAFISREWIREKRGAGTLLAVGLFGSRAFRTAFARMFVASGASSGTAYLAGVYLQTAEGRTPVGAGLALLPLALGVVAGGAITPHLTRYVSRPWATRGSLAAQVAGLAVLAVSGPGIVGLSLVGLGFGLVGALASATLFDATPQSRAGDAGALQEIAFALGAGTGVAVFAAAASIAGPDGFTVGMVVGAVLAAVAAAR